MSQWGHDFRPDYFRLADAARWLGAKAIVASTATATPQVAADIVTRLGLRDPVRVATGFDRPNLSFAVVPCATKEAGHRGIAAALAEPERAAGDRLRGHARTSATSSPTRLARELGVEVARLPRGPARARCARRRSGASWPASRRSWWRPTRSAWASTRPTCGRSATRASRARSRPTTRRPAAPGATASPRAACCSPPARDKGLHVFFIERSTVDEGAIATVAQAAARPRGRRALRGRRCRSCARSPAARRTTRCARSSATSRARAWSSRRRRRRTSCAAASPASGTAARSRSAAPRRARARRRAGASTARCGRGSRARPAGALGILRHFGDLSEPQAEGPCCDVCDPSLAARAAARAVARAAEPPRAARAAPGGGRPRGARRRDPRRRRGGRSPASGARARSRSCAAGARR